MLINEITSEIIDASYSLHREVGPGLLESVYEICLYNELKWRGLSVDRQVSVPIVYKGIRFEEGYKADLVVNNSMIVELKSVSDLEKFTKSNF